MPQANIPTGNAFLFSTPKIDRYENMIVQDQRQKDLMEQRNAQALDQEFAKNASVMRDVDIPLLTKKWGEYKQAKKDLYKNSAKMSNDERIQKQLNAQRLLGEGYSIVGKSKELKAPEEELQKGYIKDPYKYDENAPTLLMQSRATPIDQHPGLDAVVNGVQLKTQDFSKNVAAAIGKQTKVGNSVQNDGLTSTPTDYMAYNSPTQFAATLSESIPDNRRRNQFVGQHSYNDLAAQDLLTRYNSLRETPEFKKAYPNEPAINPDDLNDPFKKAVVLTSIDHILRHPPTAIVGRPFNNTEAVKAADNQEWNRRKAAGFNEWLKKNKITSNQKDKRTLMNKAGDPSVGFPLDDFANKYGEDHTIKNADGQPISTIKRVYEKSLSQGELNRYNKVVKDANENTTKEVLPFKDENGDTYYNVSVNDEGHNELLGQNGKIAADESRYRKIASIPANKSKQGIYFNEKPTTTKPSKTVSPEIIKGLVGKKGYEGYSEKEIMDYYKSNGYEIK